MKLKSALPRALLAALLFTGLSLYAPMFFLDQGIVRLAGLFPQIDDCDISVPTASQISRCNAALIKILLLQCIWILAAAVLALWWAARPAQIRMYILFAVLLLIAFWGGLSASLYVANLTGLFNHLGSVHEVNVIVGPGGACVGFLTWLILVFACRSN